MTANVAHAIRCLPSLLLLVLGLVVQPASAAPVATKSVIPGRHTHVANLADWEFTVAVRSPEGDCTGVVIAPTKVLTAAHCLYAPPAAMYVIAKQISFWSGGGERIPVQSFATPGYANGLTNDLAVLTLASPTTAPAIPLATPAQEAAYTQINTRLEVAGFGVRNPFYRGKQKYGVLVAGPAFVRWTGCGPNFNGALLICDTGPRSKWVVLSGHKVRSIQSVPCFGDSGGPLVVETSSGPLLVGIAESVSSQRIGRFTGVLCGLHGYNPIHTRVSPYLGFIQANL